MKTKLSTLALTLFLGGLVIGIAAPSSAEHVGISISLGQPNFYGRIDLGDMARPPVVYSRARLIERRSRYAHNDPVYLRVPANHQRNWRKYCSRYDACGQPVYFVQDTWYRNQYVPQYRTRQQRGNGNGPRDGRGNSDEHRNDDHGNNDHRNNDKGRDHDRRDRD